MFGSPAAATSVAAQSSAEKISLISVCGGTRPGQRTIAGTPVATLPIGVLLTPEGGRTSVGPGERLRAVVGRVDHDGIVGDAEVVEFLQELSDLPIMFDHAVRIEAESGLALRGGLEVRPDVHARRVEPHEERLLVAYRAVDEILRGLHKFFVNRLHALPGQRPGILALLLAPGAKAGIVAGRISRGRDAFEHSARAELREEARVFRIVGVFGFFFGIQVIKVAEEHVEAVDCRQEFVEIAEVVLAELPRRVALRLQEFGNRRILVGQSLLRCGQADLQQPRA